ncbi:MAG TPA: macrolide family glycosyltransferase [Ktedonobacteraceae bacterium]|jgi:MGT family glycosyltransferase|nr:macrolide family glycosyltransferase [Ktedonobacteraceae bacterium]
MAKYALFSAPGHGHVNPTLAIAQELVARGEQVIYYLPETFRPVVEATGATFRLYKSEAFTAMLSRAPAVMLSKKEYSSEMLGGMMNMMVQESFNSLPQLLEEIRSEQIDYILYDRMFLPAIFLSLILHIPAVVLNPTYVLNRRTNFFQSLPPERLQAMEKIFTSLNADIARLCDTYHLPHYTMQGLMEIADLSIVFLPRSFQPGGEDLDEQRFVFVGPSLQAHRHYSGDFPLDRLDKRPQLYISLGTAFNSQVEFYNLCFDAFAQTEWQVVLAFGQKIDPAGLKETPANFIISPHVPQLEVLPRVDVFVSHGGMNSTMESLSFGVPLVVVPQMMEQEMTARRVQELGLGLALDRETLTAETLRAAVEQVTQDPGFRTRVQAMQHEVHQAGGAQRAVDTIMHYTQSIRQTKV